MYSLPSIHVALRPFKELDIGRGWWPVYFLWLAGWIWQDDVRYSIDDYTTGVYLFDLDYKRLSQITITPAHFTNMDYL